MPVRVEGKDLPFFSGRNVESRRLWDGHLRIDLSAYQIVLSLAYNLVFLSSTITKLLACDLASDILRSPIYSTGSSREVQVSLMGAGGLHRMVVSVGNVVYDDMYSGSQACHLAYGFAALEGRMSGVRDADINGGFEMLLALNSPPQTESI